MAGKAEFQEYSRGRLHRMNQGQAHHNTPKMAHTGPLCLFQGYLMQSGALTRALRFLIVLFAGTPCPPAAPRPRRWDGRSGR
jgi:hypothetical protein